MAWNCFEHVETLNSGWDWQTEGIDNNLLSLPYARRTKMSKFVQVLGDSTLVVRLAYLLQSTFRFIE